MYNPAPPAGNAQLALNMVTLSGGTNVLMSSQTGGIDADGLATFYGAQGGLSFTRTGAGLTNALVAGINLLVIDIGFDIAHSYNAAEQAVIETHLAGSGSVAFIAESRTQAHINGYNALLALIGSSITFQSVNRCCSSVHDADTILNVPLTQGVNAFQLAAANNLLQAPPPSKTRTSPSLPSSRSAQRRSPNLPPCYYLALAWQG